MIINNNNNNNGDQCDCGCNCGCHTPQAQNKTVGFEELLKNNGARSRADFVRLANSVGWTGFQWFYIGFGILGVFQILAFCAAAYAVVNFIHAAIFSDEILHRCSFFWLCRFDNAEIIAWGLLIPYLLLLIASYGFAVYWLFNTDEKFNKAFVKDK